MPTYLVDGVFTETFLERHEQRLQVAKLNVIGQRVRAVLLPLCQWYHQRLRDVVDKACVTVYRLHRRPTHVEHKVKAPLELHHKPCKPRLRVYLGANRREDRRREGVLGDACTEGAQAARLVHVSRVGVDAARGVDRGLVDEDRLLQAGLDLGEVVVEDGATTEGETLLGVDVEEREQMHLPVV